MLFMINRLQLSLWSGNFVIENLFGGCISFAPNFSLPTTPTPTHHPYIPTHHPYLSYTYNFYPHPSSLSLLVQIKDTHQLLQSPSLARDKFCSFIMFVFVQACSLYRWSHFSCAVYEEDTTWWHSNQTDTGM